jgi:hypothetical protein
MAESVNFSKAKSINIQEHVLFKKLKKVLKKASGPTVHR